MGDESNHILYKDGLNIDEILNEREREIENIRKQKEAHELHNTESYIFNYAKELNDFWNSKSQVQSLGDTDDFGVFFKK